MFPTGRVLQALLFERSRSCIRLTFSLCVCVNPFNYLRRRTYVRTYLNPGVDIHNNSSDAAQDSKPNRCLCDEYIIVYIFEGSSSQ